QHGECRTGKRNAVLFPGLHALCRNGPQPRLDIHFIPDRTQSLPGASCRENKKLKCAGEVWIAPGEAHLFWGPPGGPLIWYGGQDRAAICQPLRAASETILPAPSVSVLPQ